MGEDEELPDVEGLSPEEIGEVWGAHYRRKTAEKFAKAKTEGKAAGKEPFDLDRFFDHYVMRSQPAAERRERAFANWEFEYYCSSGAKHMTVRAFAEALNEADVYDGGDMHLD